jgi:hypothetical protein
MNFNNNSKLIHTRYNSKNTNKNSVFFGVCLIGLNIKFTTMLSHYPISKSHLFCKYSSRVNNNCFFTAKTRLLASNIKLNRMQFSDCYKTAKLAGFFQVL